MRTYAIGDIHGRLHLLHAAHERVARDREETGDRTAPIVHVGDLIDRGAKSADVVELILRGIEAGEPWVVLKGNHERMFTRFLEDPSQQDPMLRSDYDWLHPRLGGLDTLASYGVSNPQGRSPGDVQAEALEKVPEDHRVFLANLPTHLRRGELFLVHAGIRPGVPLDAQTEDDMTWIRAPFLNDTRDHGPLIVHGHSPVDEPSNYGNRLNIDTGAAYGGPLTAVVIEGREVWELTDAGRVRLPPY